MNHGEPDRCASFLWIDANAMGALNEYLGVGDYGESEKALGIDLWRGIHPKLDWPEERGKRVSAFIPVEYKEDPDARVLDDGRVKKGGYIVHNPLQNIESTAQLEDYPFPEGELLAETVEEISGKVEILKQEDAVVEGWVCQPFKEIWQLRGMDNTLCDFIINPEIAHGMYDRFYAYAESCAIRFTEAGVDVIHIHGDVAMQDRLMMSPEIWREFDKPRLLNLIKRCKGINPEVKIFMHSDGDMGEIIPDLIEAGLDILNPIQPECMDPFELKSEYGDSLVLHGAVSLQRTLPFGNPEDVREEARKLVDICGRGGGFVIGPSNSVMKEIPVENIVALYEEINTPSK